MERSFRESFFQFVTSWLEHLKIEILSVRILKYGDRDALSCWLLANCQLFPIIVHARVYSAAALFPPKKTRKLLEQAVWRTLCFFHVSSSSRWPHHIIASYLQHSIAQETGSIVRYILFSPFVSIDKHHTSSFIMHPQVQQIITSVDGFMAKYPTITQYGMYEENVQCYFWCVSSLFFSCRTVSTWLCTTKSARTYGKWEAMIDLIRSTVFESEERSNGAASAACCQQEQQAQQQGKGL